MFPVTLRQLVKIEAIPYCVIGFIRKVDLPIPPFAGLEMCFDETGASIKVESVDLNIDSGEVTVNLTRDTLWDKPITAKSISEYVRVTESDGFTVDPDYADELATLLASREPISR